MADIDRVEVYLKRRRVSATLDWRWRYVAAGNNARLASGGEAYGDFFDCVQAAGRVVGFDWFDRDGKDLIEEHGNTKRRTSVYHVNRFGGGKLEIWMVS